jgi:hypothetical protein
MGEESWKTALLEAIEAWLGPEARRLLRHGRRPDEPGPCEVLRQTPFGEPRVVDVVARHTWTIEALVGLLPLERAPASRAPG